uniref:Uncharacterized protein n=1 Tax=Moniliophthora roreri TaxID=221103 RepID=A0A0W0G1E6_MONRR
MVLLMLMRTSTRYVYLHSFPFTALNYYYSSPTTLTPSSHKTHVKVSNGATLKGVGGRVVRHIMIFGRFTSQTWVTTAS